jgi:hypothetical protein
MLNSNLVQPEIKMVNVIPKTHAAQITDLEYFLGRRQRYSQGIQAETYVIAYAQHFYLMAVKLD